MSKDAKGTCPVGGEWYTCTAQSPTFFGCCTSNPCRGNNTGCPTPDLRAAGIGSGTNPDTTENGTYFPNTFCAKGDWWTCDVPQRPTFQGCCDVNPCNGIGCPAGLLSPAAFSSIPAELSPTSSTSLPTQSSTSTPTPQPSESGSNVGAIAGGVGGGIAILIVGLVILWMCRRRRQKKSVASTYSAGGTGDSQVQDSKLPKSAQYSLLGIPISKKYMPVSITSPPVSPGPPPYQTPQQSPNPNIHEIDSIHLHEVGEVVHPSSAVQALRREPLSQGVDSPTLQSDHRSGDRPAGISAPAAIPTVEIGDGTPRSRVATPVSAMRSPTENERDGTGTYNNPRSTIVIGMMRPNENENGERGRDSYVGWQNMSP